PEITAVVSVLDGSGRPLRGLERTDFSVAEDGEPGRLLAVENVVDTQVGIAVALAIDTSGSMEGLPLQAAKDAASQFVDNLSDADEAAVVAFANTVQTAQPFTSEKPALVSSIEGLQAGGFSAVYEAALQVVQTASGSELPRRVAVLLTDGRDEGGLSQAGPTDAVEAAQASQVPFYTIALGAQADLEYLAELADRTGGRAFQAPSPTELEALFIELSEVLRSQYVLTIDSGVPADGALHELTIEVSAVGATAEATSSFNSPTFLPTITIRGLTDGAVVTGEIQVSAEVDAFGPVSLVAFLLDGSEIASFTTGPFELALDPMEVAPGDHLFVATATDESGTSSEIGIEFSVAPLAPLIQLPGLEEGLFLEASLPLTPEIRSQTPVARVEYLLDDVVLHTATGPPFSFVLDPDDVSSGSHLLTVVVTDREGSQGEVGVRFEIAGAFPIDPLMMAAGLLLVGVFALGFLGIRLQRRALATASVSVDEERVRSRLLFLTQPPEVDALLVVTGEEEDTVFRLQRRSQTIGWDQGCDIRIGSQEGRMAPVHARVWYEQGEYRIQDLGSASGTKVNGRAVPEAVLEDGDTIEIGDTRLSFKHA
ncbi:MAG: VWA domain-containing protein, partial [Anaerolineae bacterium]